MFYYDSNGRVLRFQPGLIIEGFNPLSGLSTGQNMGILIGLVMAAVAVFLLGLRFLVRR